jgi:hypothetical protein
MNIQAMSANAGFNVKSNVPSAAEESRETAAVIKAEASKGDQHAVRKLASQQQQQSVQPPVSPEGIGKAIDVMA